MRLPKWSLIFSNDTAQKMEKGYLITFKKYYYFFMIRKRDAYAAYILFPEQPKAIGESIRKLGRSLRLLRYDVAEMLYSCEDSINWMRELKK